MRFLSNFGCKIMFMCSVNFCHQQDSNSLFNGSIGHVTLSASGLLLTCKDTHIHTYIYTYFIAPPWELFRHTYTNKKNKIN